MYNQDKIVIKSDNRKHTIRIINISPSNFDLYFEIFSADEEQKHVLFNFTDYGQAIKSFRVTLEGDRSELIECENDFGWDMFDGVMCLAVGPLHEKNYKNILPASIARLYVWRFWDDARDKLKRPNRRRQVSDSSEVQFNR